MAEHEDCSYCSKSFDAEDTYLAHLSNQHADELGAIDQRRVDEYTAPGEWRETINDNFGVIAIAGIIGVSLVMVALVVVSSGGQEAVPGDIPQPDANSQIHGHGFVSLTVNGDDVDLTQNRFQGEGSCFHFHPGQSTSDYHLHCTGVTPSFAAYTLGVEVTDEGEQATFDEQEFTTADGGTIVFEVNGQEVDPYTYELTDGDRLDIRLEQSTSQSN